MKEKHTRSLAKAVSWRVLATTTTMVLVYIFTGEALLSLSVGVFESLSKLLLYYFHERLWNTIGWGHAKKQ